ncbi:hypothetical protein SAMN05421544_10271 [Riemerella columbipharyngis]|uniref:Uncharacterized protein n=1 Tax=Riemerella columbipharyngis TaxID=1071918 RepID=A0A1G6ZH62_9FLAO|nr:hypothetical protein SAMN05421544_10261 [Riemerella columbipharyngis]SDE01468.1 hypothetical protein SAMN05421544_10271 [Riemerella columbipharyngis]
MRNIIIILNESEKALDNYNSLLLAVLIILMIGKAIDNNLNNKK